MALVQDSHAVGLAWSPSGRSHESRSHEQAMLHSQIEGVAAVMGQ